NGLKIGTYYNNLIIEMIYINDNKFSINEIGEVKDYFELQTDKVIYTYSTNETENRLIFLNAGDSINDDCILEKHLNVFSENGYQYNDVLVQKCTYPLIPAILRKYYSKNTGLVAKIYSYNSGIAAYFNNTMSE
ncbi:MAG: hypothetical protein KAJ49_01500, partial [Arcobacteraceae bacterium]|nr:hypothetical protein [Arcobacteraceae bacterium]